MTIPEPSTNTSSSSTTLSRPVGEGYYRSSIYLRCGVLSPALKVASIMGKPFQARYAAPGR